MPASKVGYGGLIPSRASNTEINMNKDDTIITIMAVIIFMAIGFFGVSVLVKNRACNNKCFPYEVAYCDNGEVGCYTQDLNTVKVKKY